MNKQLLVSVIIPTKNSAKTIQKCLESILSQTYKKIEIIVIDNNSLDNTKEIAYKYTNFVFNKGPERSSQRNFGALKSKGALLLFIDSDMELSNKVVKECVDKIGNHKALIIPEKSVGNSFWAKCKALERDFYVGIDWVEAARFFSREIFKELKGYDETNTGTEDTDLPQRIKKRYKSNSIGRINSFIYHHEGNLSLWDTFKKKYYYGKTIEVYKTKNKIYFDKQANPIKRYMLFFSKPKKLFNNPIVGMGMLFMKACEFLAWELGYLSAKYI
jgi:glycosyltransferase involved in cell wall biosynthesis